MICINQKLRNAMESLAQALAALPIEYRLQVIEEAITGWNNTDYLEALQELIEKQKVPVAR